MTDTEEFLFGGQQMSGPPTLGVAGQMLVTDGAGKTFWCPPPSPPQYAQIGGCPISDLQSTVDSWNGGGSGRTFVLGKPEYQIRQAGYARQFRIGIPAGADVGGGSAKVKIVRANTPGSPTTTTWTVVGEYQITMPMGPLAFVVDLPTPIPCLPGDYPAIWLDNSSHNSITADDTQTDANVYFGNGDLATGGTLASNNISDGGGGAGIAVLDFQPFLAVCGDSIPAGHGQPNPSYTFRDAIAGTFTSIFQPPTTHEVALNLRTNLGINFLYQNFALGGSTLNDVVTTQIPLAIAANARSLIIHTVVNDIFNGRTLTQIMADLNTARQMWPETLPFIVDEVLPWSVSSGGTDANSLLTRQWNALLPAWCAANNALLILCHDKFAVTRTSTGQLDDPNPTLFSADGIHPNTAGIALLTPMWQAAIESFFAVASSLSVSGPILSTLNFSSLPTSDPHVTGKPWVNSSTGAIMMSLG